MEIESEDVAGEELMAHGTVGRVNAGGGEVWLSCIGVFVGCQRHRIDSASRLSRSKLDPDQRWHSKE